ncbi:hypothetical protein ABTH71_20290, partial [Acinetobacter baumannii]
MTTQLTITQQEAAKKEEAMTNLKERVINAEKAKEAVEAALEQSQSKIRLYEQELTTLKNKVATAPSS